MLILILSPYTHADSRTNPHILILILIHTHTNAHTNPHTTTKRYSVYSDVEELHHCKTKLLK